MSHQSQGSAVTFHNLACDLQQKVWRANGRAFNKRHPIFRDKIVGREDRVELRLATMNAFCGDLACSRMRALLKFLNVPGGVVVGLAHCHATCNKLKQDLSPDMNYLFVA
jgi:hypothetical protein